MHIPSLSGIIMGQCVGTWYIYSTSNPPSSPGFVPLYLSNTGVASGSHVCTLCLSLAFPHITLPYPSLSQLDQEWTSNPGLTNQNFAIENLKFGLGTVGLFLQLNYLTCKLQNSRVTMCAHRVDPYSAEEERLTENKDQSSCTEMRTLPTFSPGSQSFPAMSCLCFLGSLNSSFAEASLS